jgi:hypothetical protein
MTWYLQIGDGAPQLFALYGLNRLKLQIRSQRAGSFSFSADGALADSDPLAVEGTLCTVWQGSELGPGTPFFAGRLHEIPRKGSGSAESVDYEILDAWHDFERNVYQQQWNVVTGVDESGNPETASQYRSECILGMDLSGDALNSGEVIESVVEWAIGVGAYCQIGEIGVAAPVPFDEITDLPCSECIKKMLRWTPDAVAWFDYTTTPPTFNVTQRPECEAVYLEFEGGEESVDIKALPDLAPPGVVIRYLQENQTDGVPSINVIVDDYPGGTDGTEYGALVMSCRLAGTNSTYQKVPVQTAPILAIPSGDSDDGDSGEDDDTDNCNWWRNHVGWLYQFQAGRLNLDDDSTSGWVTGADGTATQNTDAGPGNPVDYTIGDYPNELLRGALADWMNVIHAKCSFTTSFTYMYPDTADDESRAAVAIFGGSTDGTNATDDGSQNGITVTATLVGTNAVTQTYAQLSTYDQAEPVPTGLAQEIYDSIATLQYEGSYSVVNEEVGGWSLGTVLNLAGGREEWAGMNALLQEIEQDLDNGRTTLKFGAAGHLTLQDLMEQLRANRTRTTSSHIKERESGQPSEPTVNNTTHSPFNDASTPPNNQNPPWEGWEVNQDGSADTPNDSTYNVVIGYGDSSIVQDSLPNPLPIENFEISVGNDGSDWPGPSSDGSHNASSLNNVFSVVSGDSDYTKDRIWTGAMNTAGGQGGSIYLNPSDPSIKLSPNLDPSDDTEDDQHIHIDLSESTIEIQDGSGNLATLTPTGFYLGDGEDGEYNTQIGQGGMQMSVQGITLEASPTFLRLGIGTNAVINLDTSLFGDKTLAPFPISIDGQDYTLIGCVNIS